MIMQIFICLITHKWRHEICGAQVLVQQTHPHHIESMKNDLQFDFQHWPAWLCDENHTTMCVQDSVGVGRDRWGNVLCSYLM